MKLICISDDKNWLPFLRESTAGQATMDTQDIVVLRYVKNYLPIIKHANMIYPDLRSDERVIVKGDVGNVCSVLSRRNNYRAVIHGRGYT